MSNNNSINPSSQRPPSLQGNYPPPYKGGAGNGSSPLPHGRGRGWVFFLFLLPLLLLATATELYVRSLPNSYRIKRQMMERMEDSVETIILGNSHAYSGIRPELLPGCAVNLANVSQTLDLDLLLLEYYAPRCPRLRHIILTLDNSNLFDLPMQQTDEWFRCGYYRRYMHLGPYYRLRYWLELFHVQSARGKMEKWIQQQHPDCTPLGWDTDNSLDQKNQKEWNTSQVERVLSRHHCSDWQQAQENQRLLLCIANYCCNHQLQLTLVAPPVYRAYSYGIPRRQRDFINQARQLCTETASARVLDFVCDSTYLDDDFFDPDHLTHEGAAKFTLQLADSLAASDNNS